MKRMFQETLPTFAFLLMLCAPLNSFAEALTCLAFGSFYSEVPQSTQLGTLTMPAAGPPVEVITNLEIGMDEEIIGAAFALSPEIFAEERGEAEAEYYAVGLAESTYSVIHNYYLTLGDAEDPIVVFPPPIDHLDFSVTLNQLGAQSAVHDGVTYFMFSADTFEDDSADEPDVPWMVGDDEGPNGGWGDDGWGGEAPPGET